MKKGFTLVEIIVVMAIITVVGIMLTEIFYRSLRGSDKAAIIAVIKQNGQSVLENMDKTIRNSGNIVAICDKDSDGYTDTIVINKDGLYTRYVFQKQIKLNTNADTNGLISSDILVITPVDIDTADKLNGVCMGSQTNPQTSPLILTDISKTKGVSILLSKDSSGNSLPFVTRNKLEGYKDTVAIQFSVGPATSVPASISNQIDAVSFATTIGVR